MGDFNSKIGRREHQDEDPIGPYGCGTRNERGDRLIQFAQGQRLKIINSFFKKNPASKWTWRAPNGITKNETDFILSDTLSNVQSFRIINGLKFDTDHRMLCMKIITSKQRRQTKTAPRLRAENINDMKYRLELRLLETLIAKM
jgi:hypothetical protein